MILLRRSTFKPWSRRSSWIHSQWRCATQAWLGMCRVPTLNTTVFHHNIILYRHNSLPKHKFHSKSLPQDIPDINNYTKQPPNYPQHEEDLENRIITKHEQQSNTWKAKLSLCLSLKAYQHTWHVKVKHLTLYISDKQPNDLGSNFIHPVATFIYIRLHEILNVICNISRVSTEIRLQALKPGNSDSMGCSSSLN